ncbi:MAG: VWA domain-containing protein [Ignavibacteriae bacterium]|nr:VWA domain-containing protein [Ignavibacteriota bacterium]
MCRVLLRCAVLAVFLSVLPLRAQNAAAGDFRITAVDTSDFPRIELRLEAPGQSAAMRGLSIRDLTLTENGIAQRIESLLCPGDSLTRFSVLLLLDRSASMARLPDDSPDIDSTKLRAAKRAASVFLRALEPRDEAAVCSFSSETPDGSGTRFFVMNHPFSRDTAALVRSLVPITAAGGTWLWQAATSALEQLAARPGRRVLIVLTDGRNQGDERLYSSASVIDRATTLGIPVFAVGLGSDVDRPVLENVARATGGRSFFAPRPEELEREFLALADHLLTDACLLRYTSSHACLDGSRRDIELMIRAGTASDECTATYTAGAMLVPAVVSLSVDGPVDAGSVFRTPLSVARAVSTTYTLSARFEIAYDTTALEFAGLAQELTIFPSEICNLTVQDGILRVSAPAAVPLFADAPLCVPMWRARLSSRDRSATLALLDAQVEQYCLATRTVEGGTVDIRACVRAHSIGSTGLSVTRDGLLRVPVVVFPPVPMDEPFRLHMTVDFDTRSLSYRGLEADDALALDAAVTATAVKGALSIDMQGRARAERGRVATLLFTTENPPRAGTRDSLLLRDVYLETACAAALSTSPIQILLDGLCAPLLQRRAGALSVSPSPSRGLLTARFTLAEAEVVILRIYDGQGREVWLRDLGMLTRGEHTVPLDNTALPAGQYTLILGTSTLRAAAPLLLLR